MLKMLKRTVTCPSYVVQGTTLSPDLAALALVDSAASLDLQYQCVSFPFFLFKVGNLVNSVRKGSTVVRDSNKRLEFVAQKPWDSRCESGRRGNQEWARNFRTMRWSAD
jgi:hypothetical protein